METALIIAIAVVGLLAVFALLRRGAAAAAERRREKASELRIESAQMEESARKAEIRAGKEREAAEARAVRADRIDPDTGSRPGRGLFRRGGDETDDEVVDEDDRGRAEGDRPGVLDRLLNR